MSLQFEEYKDKEVTRQSGHCNKPRRQHAKQDFVNLPYDCINSYIRKGNNNGKSRRRQRTVYARKGAWRLTNLYVCVYK